MVVTIVGLAIAIVQLRKIKTAADAANEAVLRLSQDIMKLDGLVELHHAISQIENTRSQIESKQWTASRAYANTARRSLIQYREFSENTEGNPRVKKVLRNLVLVDEKLTNIHSSPDDSSIIDMSKNLADSLDILHSLVGSERAKVGMRR